MTREELLVELPVRPESAASAREALTGFRRYLDRETYVDLRWVISELVADAIRTEDDRSGPVRLAIAIREDDLEVTVAEGPSPYMLRPRRPAFGRAGWGVYLAGILGSSWGARHEAEQGCVWVRAPLAHAS